MKLFQAIKHYAGTAILLVFSLFVLVPVWMLFTGAFMGTGEIAANLGPVLLEEKGLALWPLIPRFPTLKPLVELLLDSPEFFTMFWNTCALVFPILAGHMLIAVPAAWAFARYRFRGRKTLYILYIVLMLMPFQVTMVSSFLALDRISLLDTRAAVILPAVFSTFPVFMLIKFFASIPQSFIEAAQLDGAGALRVFWYIGVPLGMPGVMSVLVLGFLEYWNVIEQPLVFLQDRSLWPLSLFLPEIVASKAGVSLIASIVMMMPALLIFGVGQKHLEEGIRAAGLKE